MSGQELFDRILALIASGRILLLDISHWQGNVDFQRIKDLGFYGVYLKVSDPWNIGYEDAAFQLYRHECRRVGLAWGGYHFFRPEHDGTQQATRMLGIMGDDRGPLPPMADVEYSAPTTGVATFRRELKEFLATLFFYDGRVPGLYTRATFIDPIFGDASWLRDFWQFIAHYSEAALPDLPLTVALHTIRQKWADGDQLGPFLGIESRDVDVDIFNGPLDTYWKWAQTGRFPEGAGTPIVLPPPTPLPTPIPTPGVWGTGKTKVYLKLRAAPIDGAVLLTMPINASVVVLAAPVQGWANVRYGSTAGWCSANPSYITITQT